MSPLVQEKKQRVISGMHKDITRVDKHSSGKYGWLVRVRFKGKIYSKLISDRKSGGKDAGLVLAIEWRDNTEKRLGKIRTDKHIVTSKKSGTGVVGVCLNKKLNRYDVTWVDGQGKQHKTSVSITKHGPRGAFYKACALRNEMEYARHGKQ